MRNHLAEFAKTCFFKNALCQNALAVKSKSTKMYKAKNAGFKRKIGLLTF